MASPDSPPPPLLTLDALSAGYGDGLALHEVSLVAYPGQVTCVIVREPGRECEVLLNTETREHAAILRDPSDSALRPFVCGPLGDVL